MEDVVDNPFNVITMALPVDRPSEAPLVIDDLDPPWKQKDLDYIQYLPGDTIDSVRMSWTEDPAFLPTSIIYGLAFIIGVAGNSLVILALLGDRKARNATCAFLVSLAMGDLLFLVICIPYETVTKLTNIWVGGVALCKLSGYVEMLSAAASILNLTAVSVER